MGRSPHSSYTFEKTPGQKGRDALREQETYDKGAFRHDYSRQQLAALQAERAQLIAAGISPNRLPEVHPNMSPQDIAAASQRHQQLLANIQDVHPGFPDKSAPSVNPPSEKLDWFSGGYSAQRPLDAPIAPAKTPVAGPRPFAVPAMRADGTQMKNFDGTPRTLERTPNIVESNKAKWGADFYDIPLAERAQRIRNTGHGSGGGVTTDPGVSPFNFKGERQVDTAGSDWMSVSPVTGKPTTVHTGGAATEVDGTHDLRLNRLSKGDPLLPKGATSGLLVPGSLQTGDYAYTAPPRAAKPPTVGDTRVPELAAPDAFATLTPPPPPPATPPLVDPQARRNFVDARMIFKPPTAVPPFNYADGAAAPGPIATRAAGATVSPTNAAIGGANVIQQGQRDAATQQTAQQTANEQAARKTTLDAMNRDAQAKAEEIRRKQAAMGPWDGNMIGP